jgi:hypothetical protein
VTLDLRADRYPRRYLEPDAEFVAYAFDWWEWTCCCGLRGNWPIFTGRIEDKDEARASFIAHRATHP